MEKEKNAELKIDEEFENKQKLLLDESNAFVDHKKKVMRSPRAAGPKYFENEMNHEKDKRKR